MASKKEPLIKFFSKSNKKKIRVISKSNFKDREFFWAEIVENIKDNIIPQNKEVLTDIIQELVKKNWGHFDDDYIEKSVYKSHMICFLWNNGDRLVGVAPIKEINLKKNQVYSFGLTVVDSNYQNYKLLKKMELLLIKRLFVKNIIKGKFNLEFIFITPNVRTLGAISRASRFIYPNPYKMDIKTQKIEDADDETWNMVNEYLAVVNEKPSYLNRNGCIMKGFYDNKPHLIREKVSHKDPRVNAFGEKYLYNEPGKEVVVRAKIDLRGLFFR